MTLLVPKSKYSRLQLPYGVASASPGFEEPQNAMPGTLGYDPLRDVVRVKVSWDGWQDLIIASGNIPNLQGARLAPSADGSWPDGTYTRIYLAPVTGNLISLWTDAPVNTWVPYSIDDGQYFYDLSGRTAFTPFDVFVFWNTTTKAINFEIQNWASQTARSVAIEKKYGVWVKQGVWSRRLMGTCFPRSATQYVMNRNHSGGGTVAAMDLWNVYNRKSFAGTARSGAATWVYDSTTWRVANGDTNNNSFEFTYGLQEDVFLADAVHAVRDRKSVV